MGTHARPQRRQGAASLGTGSWRCRRQATRRRCGAASSGSASAMTVKQTTGKRRIGDGTPGPGRPKGSANKATAAVRDAIARVLESNAENFGRWLASVAEGEKEPDTDQDGKPILDKSGTS